MDPSTVVGWIANILTIVAAIIALLGVAATWLTRPRLQLTAHAHSAASASINLHHGKGSAPARNLYLGWGAGIGDDGIAMMGDGGGLWTTMLVPGTGRTLTIFDPKEMFFSSPASESETRFEAPAPAGFIAELSWQRTMVPWLRTNRVVLWSKAARIAGEPPIVLKGRAGARAYASAMSAPKS